jgi:hypothetical protein
MQKLSLLLGLLLFASGNIAQANNRDEALAVDSTSSPVQAHCADWSAALLLAATDPALPDFLQHQPHCLQKINAWSGKATMSYRDFDQMFARFDEVFLSLLTISDKVAFTLGFIDEVSKVHPVSIRPRHNDLPDSLRFVQKSHTAGNAYRRMDLTTIEPNQYRLTEAEFRQFASNAVRSTRMTEQVLYVIHGNKLKKEAGTNSLGRGWV